ncbi:MAG: 16S rRNA (guanine(966)-N(2))-methyltransferase RsmD [Erysipelotrichaceae bacterium]|nr:16S rRNA (guanine(966)-N(2))-methyltransferase RsmD [Erysipelotrichaceae bacterium]MBQ9987450.1 16S rRNA (guanine(966)-N(2))-methyltransferase RsmD [Erysipelotrichales bacterium]MBR3694115.1 16S rRNA (guanine(966)-N(2))-methyltransferase RsmD [Erysipelotrichales bacterium]
MRVIAGRAKGREIIAPEGLGTRPIMAKMKEALFSMWQFRIQEATFLDLFAGSGSMGIEAISRGAKKAVFVELEKKAIDVIKQNIRTCKFEKESVVYKDDVFNRVKLLQAEGETFDIIYMDPPFTVDSIFHPVLEAVAEAHILKEDGVLAIRSLKEKDMPEVMGNLEKFKLKTYGISAIHFYRIKEEEE